MDDKISEINEQEQININRSKPLYKEPRFVISMVFCGIALLCAVVSLIWHDMFFIMCGAIMFASIGAAVLLLVTLFTRRKYGKNIHIGAPLCAVLLELIAVSFYISARNYFYFFNFIAAMFLPIIAVAVSGASLCYWKNMCKAGRAMSIVAFFLPIAIVITIITLLSAGVIRISLM